MCLKCTQGLELLLVVFVMVLIRLNVLMFFVLVLTYSKMIRGFPIVLLVLMVLTISL